jgi:hypothetical protein
MGASPGPASAHTTARNCASSSARPNSTFSHSGARMRCGGGTQRGRRVSEVWERAGMTWGVVWGRAREYGAWDALAVGLGASLGARACLVAIETRGDVSACAHEVGHRARA